MTGCVVGIGIDLVDVDELDQLLVASDRAFLETAWTPWEVVQSAGQSGRLAVCWAAKEAAMKAVGIGIGDIDPFDVEVDMEDQQEPVIRVSRSARAAFDRQGVSYVALSVARDRHWAIATAIAIGNAR